MVSGKVYLRNAKGGLTPIEMVRAQDLLQDDVVRELFAEAEQLAATIAAFKAKCFEHVETFNALLADKYGAKAGGAKGNMTLATFDGLKRMQIQVADQQTFGPELQQAKALVDECLTEWAADSRAELRALVDFAFQVDKEGQINRGRLFGLLRLEIADERWTRGMQAIRDSIKVTGSKSYIRFHDRPTFTAGWRHVSLDAATA